MNPIVELELINKIDVIEFINAIYTVGVQRDYYIRRVK